MFARRKVGLLFVSAAILMLCCACGFSSQSAAPGFPPPGDLITPSGIGGLSEPTEPVASALLPYIQATATAQQPTAKEPVRSLPLILESRRLTLEYPSRIRTGDSDVMRLTLEVDTDGNVTPTVEIKGHVVAGQTILITNIYNTHNVLAEARLDLAGPDVRPVDLVSEPLIPGESVTFYWSIHPTQSGIYRGTIWLFLRFVDKVSREGSQEPVSAQTVQVEATNIFGLNGNAARTAGGLGTIVGAVLGFPFVGDILRWVWCRIRRGDN